MSGILFLILVLFFLVADLLQACTAAHSPVSLAAAMSGLAAGWVHTQC